MSASYSYEQATGLLQNLAANEELRRQLLANPEETFHKYGFEIDPAQLPARRELASKARLDDSARTTRRKNEEHQLPSAIFFISR